MNFPRAKLNLDQHTQREYNFCHQNEFATKLLGRQIGTWRYLFTSVYYIERKVVSPVHSMLHDVSTYFSF